ncbi:MAG: IS21-like element helper ATPase IstB [Euryarchaeota archaeon]|jgi:DNA replication protein DnaC|nr:IS21-like element helper ATPase IstB [Euryarchaeota archaeon]MDX9763295.1 IS21-like element helper ATPase IstB [Desulfomonilia bacterium]
MSASTLERQIGLYAKELRLPAVRESYADLAHQAQAEGISYPEYLLELLRLESDHRRQNRTQRWLRESRLPLEKNLEAFDLSRVPTKVMHQVRALQDGSFLGRRENVLAFGNPGSGKTHLLCALGQELILQGYKVYFTKCSSLVEELLREKKGLKLDRKLKKLSRYDALIIDDIGYVHHDRDEIEVLFTLLAQRYERGSVMISSNLAFSKWESIFKDPMTTAAAIDRLVHHSIILEMNCESYRMEQARRRSAAP